MNIPQKSLNDEILEIIDQLITPHTPFLFIEICQLKTKFTLDLIADIFKNSNKSVSESVAVFLAAIRYLNIDSEPLQEFVKNEADTIYKLAVSKSAQANLPSRGLPIFEIIAENMPASSTLVIELGASMGLVGRCLLNPIKVIEKRSLYFSPNQQFPDEHCLKPIDYYLGIELYPPEKEWILAWMWNSTQKKRLDHFIEDIIAEKGFQLITGSAIGFSSLKTVNELARKFSNVIVLTSFMFHQQINDQQQLLRHEIFNFVHLAKGHWINLGINKFMQDYYIQLDGKIIIQLSDDTCRNWKWIKSIE